MSFIAVQDAKEQIRQAVEIVALIGADVPLRRQGRIYVGLCPWHDDTRPSFQVNPERQTWRCWVCNLGGDIFSYVMQRERVDFRQALSLLAEQAGVTLEAGQGPRTRSGDANDKQTLLAALAWAETCFRECLQHSAAAEPARAYLQQRGITEASRQRFHLGFSPDQWQWLLDRARSSSFSTAVLEATGLVGRSQADRHYDRFKGRVIFPIHDVQGRTVAFGGRILPQPASEKAAKYINSPETPLFSKSNQLYGLDVARDAITKSRRAIVVEGYTDVILAHQTGVPEAVAVLGTALGPRHVQLLRRYADSIVLVLDGDEAGQRRTNEVLELFVASEVDLRVLTLPAGLDPCDFLLEHGATAFKEAVEGAEDAFQHAMRVHLAGIDPLIDTHRGNQALEHLLSMLAKAPRLSRDTSSSRMLRERQVLVRLAREFRVDERSVRERLAELRRGAGGRSSRPVSGGQARVDALEITAADAELLEILIRHPKLVHAALEEITSEDLTSPAAGRIFDHYRLLADAGEDCEFAQLLTAIEEPQLKRLLVDLDERAAAKERLAQADAAARLRQMIDDVHYRRDERTTRDRLAAIEEHRVSEEEEIAILKDLLDRERKRQGIPAPTDG